MNASASRASPSTLSATCKINQALRPAEGSAPGARPISKASPTRPVASGLVKNATAEPRNSRSLASCSSTRHSASIDSAGASPTRVSRETATTWMAAPAQGSPMVRTRGATGNPTNGASVSAVARPYSARARICRVRITLRTRRRGAAARGDPPPGRRSGGHLLDQPHRQAGVEGRVADLHDEPRGGMLARVHDHQDRADLFGGRSRQSARRAEHLEHIAQSHTLGAPLVDEEELLRPRDPVHVARRKQPAGETLLDGRRPHFTRILEGLE